MADAFGASIADMSSADVARILAWAGQAGERLLPAHAGADAPTMVAGGEPILDGDMLIAKLDPAANAADLVEAGIIFRDPAIRAREMMRFQRGRHGTGEDEIRRKTVRFTGGDGETQFLRAQNFDVNGTGTHAARVDQERARDSQIMLLAILDDGKEPSNVLVFL